MGALRTPGHLRARGHKAPGPPKQPDPIPGDPVLLCPQYNSRAVSAELGRSRRIGLSIGQISFCRPADFVQIPTKSGEIRRALNTRARRARTNLPHLWSQNYLRRIARTQLEVMRDSRAPRTSMGFGARRRQGSGPSMASPKRCGADPLTPDQRVAARKPHEIGPFGEIRTVVARQ